MRRVIKNQKIVFIGLAAILGLVIVSAVYWYIKTPQNPSVSNFTEVRANSKDLHFINPLLFYKSQPDSDYNYIQSALSTYIATAKSQNNATDVSVYFRDMNSGEWTEINDSDTYEPASMLKVVMMIAYLKRASEDPTILEKKIYYQPTSNADEAYASQDKVAAGYYTVNDLINWMIVYSDNDALTSLSKEDDNHTAQVFSLFQLSLPTSTTTPDYMSARNYSRIFRVLYDSSYLPWDSSEKALELLSRTDFTNGLSAGVPQDTVVSHKFGERTNLADDGTITNRELHDCGIIYKGKNPYFLCIMTKGSDFSHLQKIISDISGMVYKLNKN
jgi:beta-lactamase class A